MSVHICLGLMYFITVIDKTFTLIQLKEILNICLVLNAISITIFAFTATFNQQEINKFTTALKKTNSRFKNVKEFNILHEYFTASLKDRILSKKYLITMIVVSFFFVVCSILAIYVTDYSIIIVEVIVLILLFSSLSAMGYTLIQLLLNEGSLNFNMKMAIDGNLSVEEMSEQWSKIFERAEEKYNDTIAKMNDEFDKLDKSFDDEYVKLIMLMNEVLNNGGDLEEISKILESILLLCKNQKILAYELAKKFKSK